ASLFLLLAHSPSSPLFPYTTLFRSKDLNRSFASDRLFHYLREMLGEENSFSVLHALRLDRPILFFPLVKEWAFHLLIEQIHSHRSVYVLTDLPSSSQLFAYLFSDGSHAFQHSLPHAHPFLRHKNLFDDALQKSNILK